MKQRRFNFTFVCQNCKRTVTEKVAHKTKKYCKKCNPVKVWWAKHPGYWKKYLLVPGYYQKKKFQAYQRLKEKLRIKKIKQEIKKAEVWLKQRQQSSRG